MDTWGKIMTMILTAIVTVFVLLVATFELAVAVKFQYIGINSVHTLDFMVPWPIERAVGISLWIGAVGWAALTWAAWTRMSPSRNIYICVIMCMALACLTVFAALGIFSYWPT